MESRVSSDPYRKAVPTLIALCVIILVSRMGLLIPEAQAQEPPSRESRTWISAGLGGSLAQPGRGNPMGTLALDLNHQTGPRLFELRAQRWFYLENDKESFSELGLLYGRATRRPSLLLAVAAGIGAAQVCDLSGCTNTVGIPIMVRGAIRPVSVLGLATQFVMNINSKHTVSAVQIMLEIGKLR